jgi:hypothetical protein
MEQLTESFKVCKLCSANLPLSSFRPKRNMCKCCVTKREEKSKKEILRQYYAKNKDKLNEYRMGLYWKSREGLEDKQRGRPRTTGAGARCYKENLIHKTETEAVVLCV